MLNDDPLQANTYISARRRHILQGGSASMLLALGVAYTGWSNAAAPAAFLVPNQDTRMKIILCSRRHPSMTRAQFYEHLIHKHAPLVKRTPEFMRHLRQYVQNHARLPEDGMRARTAFRHAVERDSVIELWFDDQTGLLNALAEREYLAKIRPDEAHFNALDKLVILATNEIPVIVPTIQAGKFKSFDFIRRRNGIDREAFINHWANHARLLAASSQYTSIVRKSSRNVVLPQENNPFGTPADFDGVVETWFDSVDDVERLAQSRLRDEEQLASEAKFIESSASFSVLGDELEIVARVN